MTTHAERSAKIDAEIEALARKKEAYKAEAAAVERERQLRSSNANVDNRELPLVGTNAHMQQLFHQCFRPNCLSHCLIFFDFTSFFCTLSEAYKGMDTVQKKHSYQAHATSS